MKAQDCAPVRSVPSSSGCAVLAHSKLSQLCQNEQAWAEARLTAWCMKLLPSPEPSYGEILLIQTARGLCFAIIYIMQV